MIFSNDGATFTRRGPLTMCNVHICSHENPYAMHEDIFQRHIRINGIINNPLIGPFFQHNHLIGQYFLQEELPILLNVDFVQN